MRYLALLRGINVGGANKIEMKELKAVFEAAGMTSVRTYIASGNVLFETEGEDRAALTAILEAAIEERFGSPVGVLVLDEARLRPIVEAIPPAWTNDDAMKCDVLFLWEDVDRHDALEPLQYDPAIDDIVRVPGAVIRRIDRQNVTRSRFTRIVGTPLYRRLTIRNCNTARKLLELLNDGSRGLSE